MITFEEGTVHVRSAPVAAFDSDTGVVEALLMTYETEVELEPGLREVFTRGAFAAALGNPPRVVVSNQGHDRGTSIGKVTELREDGNLLMGTMRISDTAAGRDVLTLLRDEVLTELSVEFKLKKGGYRVSCRDGDTLVRHDKATLVGISPVPAGAYGDASRVLAVRAAEMDRTRERVLAELRSLTAGLVQE
jgi:HK97 family phage prohead protease